MKEFNIASRKIGLDRPIFIAAEVGTTCNGDVETAKKLIDAAKDAGLDAVKFQHIDARGLFSDPTITYTYTRYDGKKVTENLPEMLKQYVMTKSQWREIYAHAKKRGIIMFATPDSDEGVALMESLHMPAYKISTWDVTYFSFLRTVARIGKPVIIDLGASELEEVARVASLFKEEGNDKLILLHCFHTHNFNEMNLRTIQYLRDTFGYFSGFSAPDTNNAIDYAALAFQPVYIEKRLTLDRNDPHHHHAQALEPKEMKEYVATVRELQTAIGSYALLPTAVDLEQRRVHFRSLVAKRSIKAGEVLTTKNIACRRPLRNRLDPKYMEIFLDRKVKKGLKENEPLTWDSI